MPLRYFYILFVLASIRTASAQCPPISITVPSQVCEGSNFLIQNNTSASSVEWDLCPFDLQQIPAVSKVNTLTGIDFTFDLSIVRDNGLVYGFALGFSSGSILRLDFAGDVNNTPLSTDLGNPGGLLNSPSSITILKEGTTWFGLVTNAGDSNIILLNFGTSLTNTPSASVLTTRPHGSFSSVRVMEVSSVHHVVLIGEYDFGNAIVIDYTQGFLLPPASTHAFAVPGSSPIDIGIMQICGNWYAFLLSLNDKSMYRLAFGSNFLSTPTITNSSLGISSSFLPYRLAMVREGDSYYGFVTDANGGLGKLDFGTDITAAPSLISLGNASGTLSNSRSLWVDHHQGAWNAFMINGSDNSLFKVSFQKNCNVSPSFSTSTTPGIIQYMAAGPQKISFTAFQSNGTMSTTSAAITVTSQVAPVAAILASNSCVGSTVPFSVGTTASLQTYGWDFGDTGTAGSANPNHVYSSAGSYTVSLTVVDANACTNLTQKVVQIFNVPSADFTLPTASPTCTNQSYSFANASTYDPGSNPTWEWRLNGNLVSSQANPTISFSDPTAQEIRLKAVLPGCQNEMIKTVSTVLVGPLVDFTNNGNCFGSTVLFNNNTSGANAYSWDFGDASAPSSGASPSHNYSTAASFQVTLTASSANGCQNFVTKPLTIYSLPQPDFSVALPPFSCNNSATPFQNNTPPLTDSNITQWSWQFGDAAAGSAQQQSPAYTYALAGTFNATLTATTDAGCSASVVKPVTISLSPTADFTVGPSCVNQLTRFTDLSSGGVQSRAWQIATASFGVPNPSYTFNSPGSFNASLSVTGANNCSNVKSKSVIVPVVPALDFSVGNPCAGKNAVFSDVTNAPTDAVVGWNWNFAGNSITGNPATNNFTTTGTYNVKMTTTHTSGCVYTVSKNVLINPSPVASFTASPDRGAAPLTVQFTNTSQQATSYSWKFNDKLVATSTRTSPVYTFASLGDYSAELTATNAQGCTDVMNTPIIVLVPSLDLVLKDFSLITDPITGKLKCQITVLNNSNIPVSASEVSLFLANKAVVNETVALNLNPGQTTSVVLSFTVSPSQFDFSFLCAEINVEKDVLPDNNKRCVNFESADYFFDPYPNPTAGVLQADWVTQKAGSARLRVFDSMGKKAWEWETHSHAGLNQAVLDLTFLTSGLYYLTIETSVSRKTTRFLRQ